MNLDSELVAQGAGDFEVGPPPLPQRADQIGVRLELASGRFAVGAGEKRYDFLVEAHTVAAASTTGLYRSQIGSFRGGLQRNGGPAFECLLRAAKRSDAIGTRRSESRDAIVALDILRLSSNLPVLRQETGVIFGYAILGRGKI